MKKLSLNKEVITKLNDSQMESVKGGEKLSIFCTTALNCPRPTKKYGGCVSDPCTTAITCRGC